MTSGHIRTQFLATSEVETDGFRFPAKIGSRQGMALCSSISTWHALATLIVNKASQSRSKDGINTDKKRTGRLLGFQTRSTMKKRIASSQLKRDPSHFHPVTDIKTTKKNSHKD